MHRECLAAGDLFNNVFDPSISFPSNEHLINTRRCVVAIPARDEEQRLPVCLSALARQRDRHGKTLDRACFGVVIFANNCRDRSAELARSFGERSSLTVRVVEASLPPAEAHAGNARRAAMDLAEAWLFEERVSGGVILTTDADSRVSEDWIAKNLAAVDAGVDAVLGSIALDEEGDLLPQALHRRGRLESAYEALLIELSALLDPLAHNPWPHHATISGASIAVTREANLRVGRLPRVPLGEDKAFVAELVRHDAKIRYCPELRVTTSGRLDGRAPGGVADTLRLRSNDPAAYCDELLEPFRVAIKRAKWRGRLRRIWRAGKLDGRGAWTGELRIPAAEAKRICRGQSFGAAWSAIERQSPLFTRQLLTPAELPGQISGARRALARLRNAGLSAREHIESEISVPVSPLNLRSVDDSAEKEVCSLVAS
jgi:hypothetical protein